MALTRKDCPWRVDLEEFIALSKTVKPTKELIETAKKLAPLVGHSTGHVEAHLYLAWKEKAGQKKVAAFWKAHGA